MPKLVSPKIAGAVLLCACAGYAGGQVTTPIRAFAPQEVAPSAPVQGTDGAWYGVTYQGGNNGKGSVYRLTVGGLYTVLHSFSGNDGANPVASLTIGQDGNLYGTTSAGGANGSGAIYEITIGGNFSLLYSFSAVSGTNSTNAEGAFPYSQLVQNAAGTWFGTASGGGPAGWGTVFSFTPGGTPTVLHSFVGTDGQQPYSGLVQDSIGNFYGVAAYGGIGYDTGPGDGCGTLYRVSKSANFKLLYKFGASETDGCNPVGGVNQPVDQSTVYGTTSAGGASGTGTVFSFDPSGLVYTQLSSFTTANIAPGLGPLFLAGDGYLYGVTFGENICTYVGGCGDASPAIFRVFARVKQRAQAAPRIAPIDTNGTVFKVDTSGNITTIHSFSGGSDGATPIWSPLEGADGNLYGTTIGGGAASGGTAYQIATGLTPIVSLTASSPITAGTPFTLTWTITNAYSRTASICYASGEWSGRKSVNGGTQSETVSLNIPYNFALTCGGNQTSYVTVDSSGCAKNQICFSSFGHNFGGVPEGTSSQYGVQVTNNYTAAGKKFPFSISLSGSTAFTEQDNCGTALAPQAKCEIIFTYKAPGDLEYDSATATVPDNGYTLNPGDTATLLAHSVAVGSITVNTFKHNFGGIPLGSTAQFGWLIANGTGSPQAISFTPNGDTVSFVANNNCPATLPTNGSCSVVFTFSPSSTSWTQLLYTINAGVPVTFNGTTGNTLTLIGYGTNQ